MELKYATRRLRHTRWIFVALPVLALMIGAATAVALAAGVSVRTARPAVIGDPANRMSGTLNAQAVADVQEFKELPITWLGESFNGLNLVAFQHQINPLPQGLPWSGGRTKVNTAMLVYGTCEPRTSENSSEVSCDPPLEIYISGPGSVPPIDQVQLHADWATPSVVRGVQVIDKGMGTELFFENGLSITVYVDTDIRSKALEALTIVNADAFALAPVRSGESLSAIGKLPLP